MGKMTLSSAVSASVLTIALVATPAHAQGAGQAPETNDSTDQASNLSIAQASDMQAAADTAADTQTDTSDENIVVTGFRTSLQKAISLKREAVGVRDSIVAEDIGKFPEQNVAESLQRIPGVFLSRDGASNEGQRISIRGLGSQYSVTTINGAPVRTTSSQNVGSSTRDFRAVRPRRHLQDAARQPGGGGHWRQCRPADPASVR
jgi:outer membrane receptor protein involved in Fe transport